MAIALPCRHLQTALENHVYEFPQTTRGTAIAAFACDELQFIFKTRNNFTCPGFRFDPWRANFGAIAIGMPAK
ncbi:hypothetical protein [Azohydromonas aeria]|uniref:hypothetical protein n=1 Tax=Azohydromonas aeria TaxID=2590212 RepID=UPI0012FBE7BC|nr:hypothetical protein [Azohydromonas aeria]